MFWLSVYFLNIKLLFWGHPKRVVFYFSRRIVSQLDNLGKNDNVRDYVHTGDGVGV